MTAKERIDILLTERGLADSRTKAQALVMAGVVLVNERRIEKPSEKVASDAAIRLKDSAAMKYVAAADSSSRPLSTISTSNPKA